MVLDAGFKSAAREVPLGKNAGLEEAGLFGCRHGVFPGHGRRVSGAGPGKGRIRTAYHEPFSGTGRFDVDIRHFDTKESLGRYRLLVNGKVQGSPWQSSDGGTGWQTHRIANVNVKPGDEIIVEVEQDGAGGGKLDYVQLTRNGQ
jgi:hypothetical protein